MHTVLTHAAAFAAGVLCAFFLHRRIVAMLVADHKKAEAELKAGQAAVTASFETALADLRASEAELRLKLKLATSGQAKGQ